MSATGSWAVVCAAIVAGPYDDHARAVGVARSLDAAAPCPEPHAVRSVPDLMDELATAIILATGCDPRTDEPELFALAWGQCEDCRRVCATAMLDLGDGAARRCVTCVF